MHARVFQEPGEISRLPDRARVNAEDGVSENGPGRAAVASVAGRSELTDAIGYGVATATEPRAEE